MSHSLGKRIEALADHVGSGCPICRRLGPVSVILRGDAEPPDPPRCPACGRERETLIIQIRRVSASDRRPA
jgi:hypothetical protein